MAQLSRDDISRIPLAKALYDDLYDHELLSPLHKWAESGARVHEAFALCLEAHEERALKPLLDLLERHLPADGKPRCAGDRETVALLREHGRLP